MITVRQQEKLIDRIKSLSELELDSLIQEISAHLRKNNLVHLIDNNFNTGDSTSMDDLSDELSEMERRLNNRKHEVKASRII